MTHNHSSEGVPKLSFLDPEVPGPGMQVYEIKLDPSGVPIAPFKASRDTVEPGCTSPVDSHLVHEIWFIAEGEGELIYDNRSMRIRSGDVVYFEPTKTHQIRNDGIEPIVFFSIWWSG